MTPLDGSGAASPQIVQKRAPGRFICPQGQILSTSVLCGDALDRSEFALLPPPSLLPSLIGTAGLSTPALRSVVLARLSFLPRRMITLKNRAIIPSSRRIATMVNTHAMEKDVGMALGDALRG